MEEVRGLGGSEDRLESELDTDTKSGVSSQACDGTAEGSEDNTAITCWCVRVDDVCLWSAPMAIAPWLLSEWKPLVE